MLYPKHRHYELTDSQFMKFKALVYEKCGIHLHEGKKELVRARLSKRLREQKLDGFDDYYQKVLSDTSGDELVWMMDAISTNLTSFFREKKHFDFLTQHVLPEWKHGVRPREDRIFKLWSAGCSSGEEPYSLGISLDIFLHAAGMEYKILATDLSTKVLSKAIQGVYAKERISNIAPDVMRNYFQKGTGRMAGMVRIRPELKNKIQFKRFNLMHPVPVSNTFHVIFCRNVMIYFDKPTQQEVIDKFHSALKPGGYLFIGHSESLMGITHQFKYIKPTIYRKTA